MKKSSISQLRTIILFSLTLFSALVGTVDIVVIGLFTAMIISSAASSICGAVEDKDAK